MANLKCPDCRRVLTFKGKGRYECTNPDCRVIEVHADTRLNPTVILKVKRGVKLKNQPGTPFRSGICPKCGRIIERIGNINIAVCDGGRKDPHPAVEVKLKRGVYEADLEAKEVK